MTGPRLVCVDLVKRHGNHFTLGPLNLEVGMGTTCLVGPNGAGKSTFFRLAAGVDRPASGDIRMLFDRRDARLGYLPQSPQLPGAATCEEFLTYVAWLHRIPRAARPDAVSRALAAVGLEDQRHQKIRRLSGGMARRVGIAHALVHDPALLLLDEPTVGLDPRQRLAVRETVAALGRQRVVVVSTHLVEDVRGLADRVLVLDDGQVVFDGDIATLEAQSDAAAPGDTELERAIASLMGADA